MSAVVPKVDFYCLYAQRNFGVAPDWQWHTLRGKTMAGGRNVFLVAGAVCNAKYASGPRKGTTNWAKRERHRRPLRYPARVPGNRRPRSRG